MSVVCFWIIMQKRINNFQQKRERGEEKEEEVDCRKWNWGYLNHFHKEPYFVVSLFLFLLYLLGF